MPFVIESAVLPNCGRAPAKFTSSVLPPVIFRPVTSSTGISKSNVPPPLSCNSPAPENTPPYSIVSVAPLPTSMGLSVMSLLKWIWLG